MADEIYKVKITSVNKETGAETVEFDETLSSVFMVGENPKDKRHFCSVVMGVSTMSAATMLASSENTIPAVKLASCLMDLQKRESSNFEDAFLNAIMKG